MSTQKIEKWFASTKFGGAMCVIFQKKKYKEMIYQQLNMRLEEEPSKWQVNWCYRDYLRFRFCYKGSFHTDYFDTQMYRKSDFVRNESFATYARYTWRDSIQDRETWSKFVDKREFCQSFSSYLEREWMIIDQNTTQEEFQKFLNDKEAVFAKIPISRGGKDVHYFPTRTDAEKKKLADFCNSAPVILEQPIVQCDELAALSSFSSVNTVRIITIIDEVGKAHIASAVLRIGRAGSRVDNYASGGMSAFVDVDTGIVTGSAIAKNGKSFVIHPDSGKQIVGFQIPEWDRYMEFAERLAYVFPTMRYVGWDIVMNQEKKLCVIEGNKDAGADLMEAGLLYGLLTRYNKLLHLK